MIKKANKIKALAILAMVGISTFTGCVGRATTVNVAGSSTVFPIAQQCAEIFNERHENIKAQVESPPSGSGGGIKALGKGGADIADASREVKDRERQDWPDCNFVDHVVAYDGVAIIVSKRIYNSGVTELTSAQVKRIYLPAGNPDKITNWNEVGGPDKEINVNEREVGSGTRDTFMEAIFGDEDAETGATQSWNANADVKTAVKNADNGIGYVGLGYVNSDTPAVKLDGVECTREMIGSGEYPISRSLHMYTDGEATGAVKEYVDFVLSEEGQDMVEKEGFIRVG
jgi:phosphate binding protein